MTLAQSTVPARTVQGGEGGKAHLLTGQKEWEQQGWEVLLDAKEAQVDWMRTSQGSASQCWVKLWSRQNRSAETTQAATLIGLALEEKLTGTSRRLDLQTTRPLTKHLRHQGILSSRVLNLGHAATVLHQKRLLHQSRQNRTFQCWRRVHMVLFQTHATEAILL